MDDRQVATLALTQKIKKNTYYVYALKESLLQYILICSFLELNFQGDSRGILSLEAGGPALNYTGSAGK